jgi:hypothetical protein
MAMEKSARHSEALGNGNSRQETAQARIQTQAKEISGRDIRISKVQKPPKHIRKQNRMRFIELLFNNLPF